MTTAYFGDICVIGMKGCEDFVSQVDRYLCAERNNQGSYLAKVDCPRFGTGEGKGVIHESMRGKDVYIICDVFNYGVTYKMYGQVVPMSPDDHFADLKRVIGAIAGKARRVTVITPMLYEGRQHRRSSRGNREQCWYCPALHRRHRHHHLLHRWLHPGAGCGGSADHQASHGPQRLILVETPKP